MLYYLGLLRHMQTGFDNSGLLCNSILTGRFCIRIMHDGRLLKSQNFLLMLEPATTMPHGV